METDYNNIECVQIYTDTFDNDPFILKFYRGTPTNDKNLIIKEALENILLLHKKDNYIVWDVADGSALDLESERIANYDVILVAKKFVQPLNNSIFVKEAVSINSHAMNKKNKVSSLFIEPDQLRQSLGPKAEVAVKDYGLGASKSWVIQQFPNLKKEILGTPNKKEASLQNLPLSEIIMNGNTDFNSRYSSLTKIRDIKNGQSNIINLEDAPLFFAKADSAKKHNLNLGCSNEISLNVKKLKTSF